MRRVLPSLRTGPSFRLVCLVITAAIVRVIFFTGFHGFDDVFYIRRAYALSQGDFGLPTTHWAARIGLVGPTAFSYLIFGVTLWSTVLFPFVCSLLTVVVAALLGRRLVGEKAAWLAALLVAIFPLDVIFASMLFPTAPVTLLCGLGYGAFLLGEDEDRPRWHLIAGVAFGLACVAHEAAAIALVFYPAYLVVTGRPRARHLMALAGFAAGLSIDPLVHGLMGNVRARLDVLAHAATAQGTASDVAYSGFNLHWLMEPFVRILAERTFGLFSWLIAPLAAYRLVRPTGPRDRVLSVILISVFLWTEFGTLSIHRYAPLARLPRYLSPLTLPAMWLLAKSLGDLARPRARHILFGSLAATSLICLILDTGNQLRPYEDIRSLLASAHPATVSVEKADEFPLRFAEHMRPPYALSLLDTSAPTADVVVVKTDKNRRRMDVLPGATQIASVSRARTAYQIVLSNPLTLVLLRKVRPPERFAEYEEKVHSRDEWVVYRVR